MNLQDVNFRFFEDGRFKIDLVDRQYYVIFFKGKQGFFSPWKPIGFTSHSVRGKITIVLCKNKMVDQAEVLQEILRPIDPAGNITIQAMSLEWEKIFHKLFPNEEKSCDCCQE